MNNKKKTAFQLLVIAVLIAIDRTIKLLIENNMDTGDKIEVISGVFSIYHIKNNGAAFSSLAGTGILLILLPAVMTACLLFFLLFKREKMNAMIEWGIVLISAGGIGNLIDRIANGVVTDYLSFWSFAIFNFADICVCVGCGLMILGVFSLGKDRKEGGTNEDK